MTLPADHPMQLLYFDGLYHYSSYCCDEDDPDWSEIASPDPDLPLGCPSSGTGGIGGSPLPGSPPPVAGVAAVHELQGYLLVDGVFKTAEWTAPNLNIQALGTFHAENQSLTLLQMTFVQYVKGALQTIKYHHVVRTELLTDPDKPQSFQPMTATNATPLNVTLVQKYDALPVEGALSPVKTVRLVRWDWNGQQFVTPMNDF